MQVAGNIMRVLITGGAGFLGINLVRNLLSRGNCEITSLDIAPFDYPEKTRITVVTGDIRDKSLVNKLVGESDLVIHTAAALPLYTREDIFSTDVDGTRNLLEASLAHSVDRFVMISTTAVYGNPDQSVSEDAKLEGIGPYGEAKILAEILCEKYRKKGLCVPVLRPKTFVGPERLGIWSLLYDWAREGKNFPSMGSGKNRYQLLDVADLCDAIFICMTGDKALVNDTFNIGATKFATIREEWQSVLTYAGHGRFLIPFPASPVKVVLKVLDMFKLSPVYQWAYETAAKDSIVLTKKIEEKLGFHPKYSNTQALIRNYKWYLANYDAIQRQTGVSHRTQWNPGILKMIKKLF